MSESAFTKGAATRARIVEAAYLLFMEQGYHATSMRQIVEKAGVTMGGIYSHYPSKEAIWESVFLARHPYQEIMELLQAAQGDTIEEFVRDAAARLVKSLGRKNDLLNLLFIELVEFNGEHFPAIFSMVKPDLSRLNQIFANKKGRLRAIPPAILARSFAGLFISFYITEVMMPVDVKAMMGTNALETIVDIYLHGILEGSLELARD